MVFGDRTTPPTNGVYRTRPARPGAAGVHLRVLPAQGLTLAPARLRLPRRRTSQPPASRSDEAGTHSASVTFALFTYAPPSPTARRAAPRLSVRPVATSRSTTVGRS